VGKEEGIEGIPVGSPVGIPVGSPVGIPVGSPVGIPVGSPVGIPVGSPVGPVGGSTAFTTAILATRASTTRRKSECLMLLESEEEIGQRISNPVLTVARDPDSDPIRIRPFDTPRQRAAEH
jgi:hypothetical protein